MLKKVIFVSRACAEATGPWTDWAMISIADTNTYDGKPRIREGWYSILRLNFHDVQPGSHPGESGFKFMSENDATQLVYFVEQVAPHVEGIVVHCKGGISRSSAVAKWIAEYYEIPSGDIKNYNKYVYTLLIANQKPKY